MLKLIKTIEGSNIDKNLKKIEVFDGEINYLFIVKHYKTDKEEFTLVDLERKNWEKIELDNYELYLNIDLKSMKYKKPTIVFKGNQMSIEEIEKFIEIQKEVVKFVKNVEDYLGERDMFCK